MSRGRVIAHAMATRCPAGALTREIEGRTAGSELKRGDQSGEVDWPEGWRNRTIEFEKEQTDANSARLVEDVPLCWHPRGKNDCEN